MRPVLVRVTPRPGALGTVTITAPPDKAICQRALVLAALADGVGRIGPWVDNRDTSALMAALSHLGVRMATRGDRLVVCGTGLHRFAGVDAEVNVGNSATAARLMLAVAAGQPDATVTVTGNAALRRRPMWWLADPLRAMGAKVEQLDEELPLRVQGLTPLRALDVVPAVHSAQAKSALLFASLFADGRCRIGERAPARDHTQRLLSYYGVDLATDADGITTLRPPPLLTATDVLVPGDVSAVAPLIAAAAGRPEPGTTLVVHNVGLNPTRTGLITTLVEMGADITVEADGDAGGEPVGRVVVRSGAPLQGVVVRGHARMQSMIDELTLLSVVAAGAEGTTVVRDAGELRDKDTDRLEGTVRFLRTCQVPVEKLPDGFAVTGPSPLRPDHVDVGADHRLVMAAAVAASLAPQPVLLSPADVVAVSNRRFFTDLQPFAEVAL